MKESWDIQQKKLDSVEEGNRMKSKHFIANEKGIVYQRKQMFVCEKMVETQRDIEDSTNRSKREPTCVERMDKSLQLLKKEMVELAYLNVQLMEKMIEMQSQIESIKQERMDVMLELHRSELFEKKVENLSSRNSFRPFERARHGSVVESSNQDPNISETVFFAGRCISNSERNIRPGRKSTIDSISSLPSVSSIQSEGSFSVFDTDTEEDFHVNESETASSDSGIEIRCGTIDVDIFLSATTSDV